MDQQILERANYWATSNAFDMQTKNEIKELIEKKDKTQLTNRFYRNLEFGTGGMRGIMGAGTAMMNIYNIRKASAALSKHLIAEAAKDSEKQQLKIAISFDSRNNGREFARAAAEVFASFGIKALITKQMRPVPMLSFMVRFFKCNAGVCVTASHNPPAYNGYKVYWSTGGQLVPPHDKKIVSYYNEINNYSSITSIPYEQALNENLVEEIGDKLDTAYFKELEKLSLNSQGREGFKIAYSPIHGTGIYAVPQALKRFGFDDIIIVPEQKEPNGNFPTVKSPNPEDPDAMAMVLELAKKENADLVIATDPDTDRIAVIAKEEEEFVWFNGNQLGCLLIDYVLGSLKRANALPSDATIIKTIVTTELQDLIAEHYGVDSTNTLTGFKWICDLIERYETGEIKPYRDFICGGEESYGFLMGKFVRDKDAIIASCIAAEMTAWHKSKGRTLSQALDAIFARHGVYHERLHTLTLQGKEGADKIQEIMTAIRKNPPHIVGDHAVICFLDILTGEYKELGADGFKTTAKLGLPSSNVLQFYLKDNIKVSVRPSGTEPKIKFYISAHASSLGKTGHDLAPIKKQVEELTKEVENDFISLAKLLGKV